MSGWRDHDEDPPVPAFHPPAPDAYRTINRRLAGLRTLDLWFAEAHANQTERDLEALRAAVKSGRVTAETGV